MRTDTWPRLAGQLPRLRAARSPRRSPRCSPTASTCPRRCARRRTTRGRRCKKAYRPGMGQYLPDRLFWAREEADAPGEDAGASARLRCRQQPLTSIGAPRARALARGLYAVTPDDADTDDLVARVEAAIAGGATRDPVPQQDRRSARSPRAQAAALAARAGGARRALHRQRRRGAARRRRRRRRARRRGRRRDRRRARDRRPGPRCVGVSCYDDLARADAAVAAGADYVAFGSFFPSQRRSRRRARADARAARAPRRRSGVPVVAIGGITPAMRATLVAAGADAVAVISAVFARDVTTARARARRAASRARSDAPMPPIRFPSIAARTDCHEPQRRALRPRPAHHSRRRQLAGARVPLGRRHAALLRRAAQGAYVCDADGKRYIDYVGSWGPAILGHAHPAVVRAVQRRRRRTACRSARRPRSRSRWPRRCAGCCRRSRWCASCRRAPRRRCRRCGSRAASPGAQDRQVRRLLPRPRRQPAREGGLGRADASASRRSAGVPPGIADDTHRRCPTTTSPRVEARVRDATATTIAAVIVEPIVGNMNLVVPQRRASCRACARCATQHGAVLIFDEVMTGFRVHPRRRAGH